MYILDWSMRFIAKKIEPRYKQMIIIYHSNTLECSSHGEKDFTATHSRSGKVTVSYHFAPGQDKKVADKVHNVPKSHCKSVTGP